MRALNAEQVRAFRHDGYLFPFPMLDEAERAARLADFDRYEAWLGRPLTQADRTWSTMTHLFLPWVDALARDARILDAVERLIGPDILVWTSTFFIKEPESPTYAAWHQDNTYFGLEPSEQVGAWLALTEANSAAGCMEVLSWGGRPRQFHHASQKVANSINRGGQTIVEALDESGPVAMQLGAGQYSLHHGLCIHRSAPNRARHRRIGLGINYIPAAVRTAGATRMAATLVRGENRPGNFDLNPRPAAELDAAGLAAHESAYARYAANYREQQARHASDFAAA